MSTTVRLEKVDDVSEALAEIEDEAGLQGIEMDELVAAIWRAGKIYVENLSGDWQPDDPNTGESLRRLNRGARALRLAREIGQSREATFWGQGAP